MVCSPRSGFSLCRGGRSCTPLRAVAFPLAVRTAVAHPAVAFQPAVGAWVALLAVTFLLPMRAPLSPHRSHVTNPARHDVLLERTSREVTSKFSRKSRGFSVFGNLVAPSPSQKEALGRRAFPVPPHARRAWACSRFACPSHASQVL